MTAEEGAAPFDHSTCQNPILVRPCTSWGGCRFSYQLYVYVGGGAYLYASIYNTQYACYNITMVRRSRGVHMCRYTGGTHFACENCVRRIWGWRWIFREIGCKALAIGIHRIDDIFIFSPKRGGCCKFSTDYLKIFCVLNVQTPSVQYIIRYSMMDTLITILE